MVTLKNHSFGGAYGMDEMAWYLWFPLKHFSKGKNIDEANSW